MTHRCVFPSDRVRILSALQRGLSSGKIAGNKAWGKYADPIKATEAIMAGRVQARVVDETYLVAYGWQVPWHSTCCTLYDELILNIGGPAEFRSVVEFMQRTAEDVGAKLIAFGTIGSSSPALSRLYRRYGFRPEDTTMVKEV